MAHSYAESYETLRLYHFTTTQYGLEAIRDNKLKIARINDANDPFELMGLALSRADRQVWRNWKTAISKQHGFICLSENWHHPMLWGHYADKHKGLCLGFDVADHLATEVKYAPERLTLADLNCSSLVDLQSQQMKELLFLKFSAWTYENEFRIFTELHDEDPVTGLYFHPFDKGFSLAEVILGERCTITREKLAKVLGPRSKIVTSFKARSGFKKFEVVKNKNKKAWK